MLRTGLIQSLIVSLITDSIPIWIHLVIDIAFAWIMSWTVNWSTQKLTFESFFAYLHVGTSQVAIEVEQEEGEDGTVEETFTDYVSFSFF